MTKKDIVLKITDTTGIKQVDVKRIVQKTFDIIIDSLIRSEKVELRNFGVFKIKERRARFGRCPVRHTDRPRRPPQAAVQSAPPGLLSRGRCARILRYACVTSPHARPPSAVAPGSSGAPNPRMNPSPALMLEKRLTALR